MEWSNNAQTNVTCRQQHAESIWFQVGNPETQTACVDLINQHCVDLQVTDDALTKGGKFEVSVVCDEPVEPQHCGNCT